MAKRFDITDKLNFNEKPVLIIKDKEIEVNDDAMTVLKIMNIMGDENYGLKDITKTAELVFTEKGKEVLEEMHLNFNDYATVVSSAVEAIINTGEEEGEQENASMT